MKITKEKFKEILVAPGFLTEEQFNKALKEAEKKQKPLAEVLIKKELIADEQLGRLIAAEFGYKFVNLRETAVLESVIKTVPELVAKMQKVIVFDKTKEGLKVAMSEPDNFEMIDWLERKTGENVIPYYATPEDINIALKHYRKELKFH